MLSIGKLTPGRADYYVEQLPAGRDDYYLAGGPDGPSVWLGSAAGRLGLEGDVGAGEFRLLLDARHPLSGDPLGVPATTARRVAGFDLCFSAPKSVSVVWALGTPETAAVVASAHDRAVAATIAVLEAEAVRARRGAGGARVEETGGVAAAGFGHRSSRAGDPQIHTHVVVANLTPDREGRWTSLYGARLYRWAKTLGYVYQAELRANLTCELGVEWGPVRNGTADLAGVPQDLCTAFSTRRAQIEARLERLGTTSAEAAQTVALATRPSKDTVADLPALRQAWAQTADRLGVTPDLVDGLVGRLRSPTLDTDRVIADMLTPDGLTRDESSFDRRHVIQTLAEHAGDGARAGDLIAAAARTVTDERVVDLGRDDPAGRRYSTAELIAVESRLIDRASTHYGPRAHTATPAQIEAVLADRPTLSDEQQDMLRVLAGTDAAAVVVIGRAGTGKTYALDAARQAWAEAGRPVIGTALAARAAAELQAGSGIPSTTLDRLLVDLDRPGPLRGLPPNAVVVVDEAGMCGTRKLDRLLAHALHRRATVVLVGDDHQLPAIETGGVLAGLAARVPVVELAGNRRQEQAWERQALAELRAGSVPAAVASYHHHGRITLAATADDARARMVADWHEARSAGQQAGMYALRRADVEDLNRRARLVLQEQGAVGPDQLTVAGRPFGVGDEVMCLHNDRRLGVRNGTVAGITGIDPERGEITLTSGTVLPADYIQAGHLGHGYAATIHKAQGATVERAFLLGSDALYREAGYVGLSRARQRSDLYLVTATPIDNFAPEVVADLTRHLTRSQAETLAVDQLQPPGRPSEQRVVDTRRAALLADPPDWAVDTLGRPPVTGPDRDRWATNAARIDSYRHTYDIAGPDLLGPQPDQLKQRRAWELGRLAVIDQTRAQQLGREQGLEL